MELNEILLIIISITISSIILLVVGKVTGILGKNKGKKSLVKESLDTYELIITRLKAENKSLNGKVGALKQVIAEYEGTNESDQDTPMITLDMIKPQLGKLGINPEALNNPLIANMANEYIKKPSVQKQLAELAKSQFTQQGQSSNENMYEV